MKKLALTFAIFCLAGCLFDKDDDKKEPTSGYNYITLSGMLEQLEFVETTNFYTWYLPIDSIFADYPQMWDQETYGTLNVCSSDGYLGNTDTTDYTNEYMGGFLGSRSGFQVPRDTAMSRNFTHWRLEIACADSIPVPPQ